MSDKRDKHDTPKIDPDAFHATKEDAERNVNQTPVGGETVGYVDAKDRHGKQEPTSGEEGYDPTTRRGYQEYPKVVTLKDGSTATVDSAEDEKALNAPKKS